MILKAKCMINWEYVGYIAATLGALSLIPEVVKALKTHHLQDLAWGMILLMFSATICWTFYAWNTNNIPLILSSGINLLTEITLMVLKVHYHRRKRPIFHKNLVEINQPLVADSLPD